MSESYLQQIVDLETEARTIYEEAVQKAARMPAQTRAETKDLVAQLRADTDAEAQAILDEARSNKESVNFLQHAVQEMTRIRSQALGRSDHAVSFILNRITGEE